MIKELIPLRYAFKFGGAQLSLRYDMRALLLLEEKGLDFLRIFASDITRSDVLEYFAVGIEQKDIPRKKLDDILSAVGAATIAAHCREAMIMALPQDDPYIIPPKPTEKPQNDGRSTFVQLYTLVCDVMGKPDEFYWSSTLRELMDRWQNYAIVKGYMKPPERVQMYDTED